MIIEPLLIFEFNQRYVIHPNGCWNWIGDTTHSNGYGRLQFNKERLLAHRVSYLIHKGNFDQSLDVLHSCDNVICVNLEHLFLGTQADNNLDSRNKLRHSYGEYNGHCKLTRGKVNEIRAKRKLGYSIVKLSKEYSISKVQIRRIINYERWKI